jgi:hypothetical protein
MKCSFYNNSGKDSAIHIFENVTCPLQIHCSIYQTFNDQVNIIYEVCPNCDMNQTYTTAMNCNVYFTVYH